MFQGYARMKSKVLSLISLRIFKFFVLLSSFQKDWSFRFCFLKNFVQK